jgi:hypothetical protein
VKMRKGKIVGFEGSLNLMELRLKRSNSFFFNVARVTDN